MKISLVPPDDLKLARMFVRKFNCFCNQLEKSGKSVSSTFHQWIGNFILSKSTLRSCNPIMVIYEGLNYNMVSDKSMYNNAEKMLGMPDGILGNNFRKGFIGSDLPYYRECINVKTGCSNTDILFFEIGIYFCIKYKTQHSDNIIVPVNYDVVYFIDSIKF